MTALHLPASPYIALYIPFYLHVSPCISRLRRQYRMAADVMAVSNALVYGGH